MADKKITALNALNATTKDSAVDLLHIIDFSGSPVNKKITVADLFSNVNTDTHIYGNSKVFEIGQAAAANSHLRVAVGADATTDGTVTINDDGVDYVDFLVKSGESDSAIKVDSGADTVTINGDSANLDFIVNGDTTAKMLFVDASADVVGVGIAAPATAYMLDVGEVGSGATGKSLQCAGGADIGGNSTITGSLGVTGATTLTGDATITGKVVASGVDTINSSAAIPTTTPTTLLSIGGTLTGALGAGTAGQIKTIICTVRTAGSYVCTPSSLNGSNTKITFDAVGESATLIYHDSEWNILALNGATPGT